MTREVRINDRFSLESTMYGWILHEYFDSQDRDGNPIVSKRTSYPYSLRVACDLIIGMCGNNADSARGIAEAIDRARGDILEAIEEMG